MANFLDKIFGSKIEVDMVKTELEASLCFHESRVDSLLARLVEERDDDALRARFSSYLLAAVQLQESQEVSVQTEVGLLETYIQLYQAVRGDQLFVQIDCQLEVDKLLPAFMLFPLITNALQQGYNSMDKFPLKIKIRAFEHALHMEVSNHVNHHIASQAQTPLIDHYKNRLITLFPERHHLLLNSNSHTFKATLQLVW
ncbi:hypothetical protein PQ465_08260 [Sphingobacterium oryzagri]|uniref:Histidine kinase n=1 Tax=Sphingobacterium oryzagri TaxID=3025669 RepID=A0ABY7WME8_9SPHI|nr:hypothetical protein [Sphingobacterium sp. KACC 22765]WDF70358.1 hypothetical protein PQ465_08260 [Sphingobacterium sp. KACC 22765]